MYGLYEPKDEELKRKTIKWRVRFSRKKKTYSQLSGDPKRTENRAKAKGGNYSLIHKD